MRSLRPGCRAVWLVLLWLTACLPLPLAVTPTPLPVVSPTATATAAATASVTAPPATQTLIVWLPEFFSTGPAAALLQEQLTAFAASHPGLRVDLRVRPESGPASLMEALRIARQAAPAVLPDLALLSRADFESAAAQGWLTPAPRWSQALQDSDWYAYAADQAAINGAVYGLPFAGDGPALAYRAGALDVRVMDWDALRRAGARLVFAPGDPRLSFPLSLALSTGSDPGDESWPAALESALALLDEWNEQGLIFPGTVRFAQEKEAWTVFTDGRADLIVARSSRLLAAATPDLRLVPLPGLDGVPYALADGWVWCLPGVDETRAALAADLALRLSAPDFLAVWSEQAAVLPVRPSALERWTDGARRSQAAAIIQSLHSPSARLALSAPLVRQATLSVLSGTLDPAAAAASAADLGK